MNFNYYLVGSKNPIPARAEDIELAKYIATDWFPGVPISAINGFADIIRSVLESQWISGDYCWCVNRDLAGTDKQWKVLTSWILGIAFTRLVIEREGYPWWSPVSAFTGSRLSGTTRTGRWMVSQPSSQFLIEKRKSSRSRLLPDYVVCRNTARVQYEFAIVESKGTALDITKHDTAPIKWSDQVKSAELFFQGKQQAVSRNIVVATRVNPGAKRPDARRITVRAWNSDDLTQSTDDVVFAAFLASHYAGVCWRLGFDQLAQAMEVAGEKIVRKYTPVDSEPTGPGYRRTYTHLEDARQSLFERAYHDLHSLDTRQNLEVLRAEQPHSRVVMQGRTFEAGLTPAALDIMRSISHATPADIKHAAREAAARAQAWTAFYREGHDEQIAVTLNGVAVFDVERPSK